MKKAAIIIAACIMLVPSALGQLIRIAGDIDRTALYLDADRLWSYNLYERSRWGVGLTLNNRVAELRGTPHGTLNLYLGYSPYAELVTGGIGGTWHTGDHQRFSLALSHDLAAAGIRHTATATLREPSSLSSFMARRLNERWQATAGYGIERGAIDFGVELQGWRGWRLYDAGGLLYRRDSVTLPREAGIAAGATLSAYAGRNILTLQGGATMPGTRRFLRLTAQYRQTLRGNIVKTHLFAQGGIVSRSAPYTFMFDLGGTWGSPLLFEGTLLTARPVEFTADLYGLASVRVELAKPLFDLWNSYVAIGSRPVPFVGVNAAWGLMRDMDGNGMLVHDDLTLQAPHMGIVEPVLGVNGLLRWGAVDWGLSVAWRIVPYGAPYRFTKASNNLSLMVTALLTL